MFFTPTTSIARYRCNTRHASSILTVFMWACIALCCVLMPATTYARIFTASTVAPGELPEPISGMFANYHIIQIGTGSAGSLSASLLAQTNCLRMLVLDDGYTVNFNDTTNGIIPGREYAGGYFYPGLEKEALMVPNDVIDAEHNGYGALWRKITGGDQRLSHYAIEMGDANAHRRLMYQPLGNHPDWAPEYVWGHVNNQIFNFSGPNITPNHANLGRIRVQESRPGAWQQTAINSCVSATGNRATYDFNTIDGGIRTCGAEPSNVNTNGLRSTSENDYLLKEARYNPNIDYVRDAKVTRILFRRQPGSRKPVAIGVEGTFRSQVFSVKFPYVFYTDALNRERATDPYTPPVQHAPGDHGNQCAGGAVSTLTSPGDVLPILKRVIVLSTGTINNPQLLKLSGVGPRAELEKWNIPVVSNLPAVGEYLKEGTVAYFGYYTNATAAEIGLAANNSDLITSRPGGFVSVDGDDMLWLMTPSNFGSLDFPFIVGYSLTFELNQERNGSVTLITSNAADYPRVNYDWNEDTMQKQIKFLKKARTIVDAGLSARFALYPFFPSPSSLEQSADALFTLATTHGQEEQPLRRDTTWDAVVRAEGRTLQHIARMIVEGEDGNVQLRVQRIKKAADLLNNVLQRRASSIRLAKVERGEYSHADIVRACWIAWYEEYVQPYGRNVQSAISAMSKRTAASAVTSPDNILLDRMIRALNMVLGEQQNNAATANVVRGVNYDDDAVLRDAVRKGAQAILHAAGTTRMTNGDAVHGVVDTNFDVYGVSGLKVTGMSIMPYFPGAGGQTWAYISAFNLQNVIRDFYNIPRL